MKFKAMVAVSLLGLTLSVPVSASNDPTRVAFDVTQIVPNGKIGTYTHGTFPSWGDRTHAGVDIPAPCGSSTVHAWRDGTVIDVVDAKSDRNFNSLGYMVIIDHGVIDAIGKRTYSIYLHMNERPKTKNGEVIAQNDLVRAGDQIGFVGETGAADGCHVHFELRHFSNRFSPIWSNIYGQGDRRSSPEFLQDWSDPFEIGSNHPDVPLHQVYVDRYLSDEEVSVKVVSPANLREKPATTSEVHATLQPGNSLNGKWVHGIDATSRWLKVSDHGYIWSGNLSESPAKDNSPFPQGYDAAYRNFVSQIPNELKSIDWLVDFAGVRSTPHFYSIDGTSVVGISSCKPHDCGMNYVNAFLWPDHSNVKAALKVEGRDLTLGNPSGREIECFNQLYDSGFTLAQCDGSSATIPVDAGSYQTVWRHPKGHLAGLVRLPDRTRVLADQVGCPVRAEAKARTLVPAGIKCFGAVEYAGVTYMSFLNWKQSEAAPGPLQVVAVDKSQVIVLGDISAVRGGTVLPTSWDDQYLEVLSIAPDENYDEIRGLPYLRYRVVGSGSERTMQLVSSGQFGEGRSPIEKNRATVTSALNGNNAQNQITENGMGHIFFGMSLAAVRDKLIFPGKYTSQYSSWDSQSCEIYRTKDDLLEVMIERGQVTTVLTVNSDLQTQLGAHVGTSEQDLKSMYGADLTREEDIYDSDAAAYFRFFPSGNGLKFIVNKGVVIGIAAGSASIRYVEGCL